MQSFISKFQGPKLSKNGGGIRLKMDLGCRWLACRGFACDLPLILKQNLRIVKALIIKLLDICQCEGFSLS
jgi:hypothetical protein